jgi:NADPH:quinone reductase
VCAALLPEVLRAIADGRIRPVIDRIVPFHDAQSAAERMRANAAVGKIVLELP